MVRILWVSPHPPGILLVVMEMIASSSFRGYRHFGSRRTGSNNNRHTNVSNEASTTFLLRRNGPWIHNFWCHQEAERKNRQSLHRGNNGGESVVLARPDEWWSHNRWWLAGGVVMIIVGILFVSTYWPRSTSHCDNDETTSQPPLVASLPSIRFGQEILAYHCRSRHELRKTLNPANARK